MTDARHEEIARVRVVHYQNLDDLFGPALCGEKWLVATNRAHAVTCPQCLEKLKNP